MVLLLIAPLVTMRTLSEERRSRTISLLLSAPVSMTEIILGKYLGVLVITSYSIHYTKLYDLPGPFWR